MTTIVLVDNASAGNPSERLLNWAKSKDPAESVVCYESHVGDSFLSGDFFKGRNQREKYHGENINGNEIQMKRKKGAKKI